MKKSSFFLLSICTSFIFQSCQFSCSAGNSGDKDQVAVKDPKNGAGIRNGIKLDPTNVKIEKAYLVFPDGEIVPQDNIVSPSKDVTLILIFESGWKEIDGKVSLGASQKMTVEGKVILDDADLFAKESPRGMPATDAKTVALNSTFGMIIQKGFKPLTPFQVDFRVWDKNSMSAIKGSYKLYSNM